VKKLSILDKILETISNTPEWKIEVMMCSIYPVFYPQGSEIVMQLKAKVHDETPLLFVNINEETLDITIDDIRYIGFTFSFYTAQNYPVESARIFAAAILAKALRYRYHRVVAPYVQTEVRKGRRGIYICIPLYLYPGLDDPYAEGRAYLLHHYTKTNFCTLRFTVDMRPHQPKVTLYYHPHGFESYEDVVSYTTDIEEALNIIPEWVALYFI
jgi:hypothetical protein